MLSASTTLSSIGRMGTTHPGHHLCDTTPFNQYNRVFYRKNRYDTPRPLSQSQLSSISTTQSSIGRIGTTHSVHYLCDTIRFNHYNVVERVEDPGRRQGQRHTPSVAFRHLPPNSARFSCATVGALFVSAQLSSALRKVPVLI